MNSRLRIGLFGGTFDPIHNGHLQLAKGVSKAFNLDQLLFIPAYNPPHKSDITLAYHRYAMAVLGTLQMPKTSVSAIELFAPDRPYSIQTVTTLRSEYGQEVDLFFMMGIDQFLKLETWYRYQALLDLCHIIVMLRPGHDVNDDALAFYGERIVDLRGREIKPMWLSSLLKSEMRIFLTDLELTNLSATKIRELVQQKRSITHQVPLLVERYINTYKLYIS